MLSLAKKYLNLKRAKWIATEKPLYCILAISTKCNHRCLMCDFWKQEPQSLSIEQIKDIFSSPVMSNVTSIGITGGEPMLKTDLIDVVKTIYEVTGGKKVSIGTNGLLPNVLDKTLTEAKHMIKSLTISIDGPREIHNKNRGREHAYEQAMKSIEVIEKHRMKDCLGISMTITKNNYDCLLEMAEKFKDYNFHYALAETPPYWFGDIDKKDVGLTEDMLKEVSKQSKEIMKRAGFKKRLNSLYNYFFTDWLDQGVRPSPCYAGRLEIFISADGRVQACDHFILGDLKKNSLAEIWDSEKARKLRKEIKNCKKCYKRCSVTTMWLNPFWWRLKVLKREILG